MTDVEAKPKPNMLRAVLVGFPFVGALGLTLALLFYALGYRHDQRTARITSIIAIVIGTQLIFAFQEQLSRPSRRLRYASLACWGVLLLAFLARLAHLFPPDL
jgi:hypothetical protein